MNTGKMSNPPDSNQLAPNNTQNDRAAGTFDLDELLSQNDLLSSPVLFEIDLLSLPVSWHHLRGIHTHHLPKLK